MFALEQDNATGGPMWRINVGYCDEADERSFHQVFAAAISARWGAGKKNQPTWNNIIVQQGWIKFYENFWNIAII